MADRRSVGSPGWIVFGDNGGGDRLAVGLTPGPCGHTGQIVLLGHEDFIGAEPADWRVLLDAGAVPRGLLAAGIEVPGDADPLPVVTLADEIPALWDRPRIVRSVLGGDLGPLPGPPVPKSP
jgi:hypothetical protein